MGHQKWIAGRYLSPFIESLEGLRYLKGEERRDIDEKTPQSPEP